jgi:hypothetical protein
MRKNGMATATGGAIRDESTQNSKFSIRLTARCVAPYAARPPAVTAIAVLPSATKKLFTIEVRSSSFSRAVVYALISRLGTKTGGVSVVSSGAFNEVLIIQ